MSPTDWFDHYFSKLTGKESAFHWQRALFEQLIGARYPQRIDLPTGTGKTTVMAVWLLAVSYLAKSGGAQIPRRLVWVVNRRVVVDQATDVAAGIATVLDQLPESDELRVAIAGMSASGRLLAVSTLRGERADNGDWKEDPSRIAIVIGTVDKIGSAMLFSGYGDSAYYRSQHAGLLTVDVLLVNDESHLSPAFAKLARAIRARNPAARIPGKAFWFVEMSATHGAETEERYGSPFPGSLEPDLAASKLFAQRYTARKRLFLDQQPDNIRLEARMFELAMHSGAARTLVFVEQPEKARDMWARLRKTAQSVELLTGTMRGLERDKLATKSKVFQEFRNEAPPVEPAWLVTTSAGEVGVDMTAERMVTDLATIDHMIQRFGRLNRFGTGEGGVHVVYTPAVLKDPAKQATLDYLNGLGDQFSSQDLHDHIAPAEAQSETVKTAELHDWLIELWCQTSDPVNDYPKVEPWLHGKQNNVAETELAWREDVQYLARDTVSPETERQH